MARKNVNTELHIQTSEQTVEGLYVTRQGNKQDEGVNNVIQFP